MKISSLIDFSDLISKDGIFYLHLNPNNYNYQVIVNKMNLSSLDLAIPQQVHSSNVEIVTKPGNYIGVDGLVTNVSNILLCLKVADCVPIYLYSINSKIIGLVHAGWRGIVSGIIQNSIEKMLLMGANLNEIKIYLGPSIGKCCYEVRNDVANYFSVKDKIKKDKWKIGIREEICNIFIKLGIIKTNINVSHICTFESKEYHSYRRDGSEAGRLISIVGIKNEYC